MTNEVLEAGKERKMVQERPSQSVHHSIPGVLWYARRLRVMSLAEVVSRIKEQWTIQKLRIQYQLNLCSPPPFAVNNLKHFSFCQSRIPCLPQFTWDMEAVNACRDQLLQGHLRSLGCEWQWASEGSIWHLAPDTGGQWPGEFSGRIAYRPGNPFGDARVAWEPSRLQHFVALAVLAQHEDSSISGQAVRLLEAQLWSWVQRNPYLTGIHYISGMECGLRMVSLCHALDLVRGQLTCPEQTWQAFLQLAHTHGDWIFRRISRYSSRGNHTIVEGTALVYLGLLFPELPDAARWLETGRRLLEDAVDYLVLPDGGSAEQAFGYHALTLDCYGLVSRLFRAYGLQFPDHILERLEIGEHFLRAFTAFRQRHSCIGDYDDGYALSPYVLLRDRHSPSPAVPSGGLQCFPSSGYSLLHSEECLMVIDHGPLGLAPCFAHGHADALSVNFQCRDRHVLIDPGTYTYGGSQAWRAYFRGTSAHNTVTVDGLDQAIQEGAFMWSAPYESKLVIQESSPNGFARILASHNGYKNLLGIMHWRAIMFYPPCTWMIWDYLDGEGSHLLELYWHCGLAPDQDGQQWFFPLPTGPLRMTIHGGDTTRHVGETNPIRGWHATSYGIKKPIVTLRTAYRGVLPHEFLTYLSFDPIPSGDDRTQADLNCFRDYIHALPAN